MTSALNEQNDLLATRRQRAGRVIVQTKNGHIQHSPPLSFPIIIILLTILATISLFSGKSDQEGLVYLGLATPLFVLILTRGRFEKPYLSPVWLMALALTTTGAMGFMLRSHLIGAGGAGISLYLSQDDSYRTAWLFAVSCFCFVLGALCYMHIRRYPMKQSVTIGILHKGSTGRVFLISSLPLVLIIWQVGTQLTQRPSHLLEETGTSLTAVCGMLSIGAVGVSGYLFSIETRSRKWLALFIGIGYAVLFFALSSRRLSLLPICFTVGMLVGAPSRRGIIHVGIGATLSCAILPIPLFLRGLPSHGLIPYLKYLGNFSYSTVDWWATSNNALVSFPITGQTAFGVPRIPIENLFIELNPLPGSIAGWYEKCNEMRLNRWTPFSAVGELGNYGYLATLLVWFAVGLFVAYLDCRVDQYISLGSGLFGVTLVGMSFLFSSMALQYSLRTFCRLLIYTFLLDAGMRFIASRPRKST